MWSPASDRPFGRATVGLPSQGGGNTDEKNHQETDEGKWD
jgi:hypothetical protein